MPKLTKITAYIKITAPEIEPNTDHTILDIAYCPHEPAVFVTIYIEEDKIPHELKHQFIQLRDDLIGNASLLTAFTQIVNELDNADEPTD